MASSPLPKRDMKILSLGLPRTGSTSMAEALTILGYKDVHHTSKYINRLNDWVLLSAAADATFPCLPTYTGKPWTREDWDRLWGSHEACTDAASMFGPELIAAYPDAKVILVHRDFDKWHKSVFGSLVPTVWGPMSNFSHKYIEPLVGFHGGTATRKLLLGLFDSKTPEEAEQRSREAYDRHAERIREVVPKDMLLEYRMGQGWEPLCEFLGKDVPDEDFPWLNEAAMLGKIAMDITITNATRALIVLLPWIVAAGAVATGVWYCLRR